MIVHNSIVTPAAFSLKRFLSRGIIVNLRAIKSSYDGLLYIAVESIRGRNIDIIS